MVDKLELTKWSALPTPIISAKDVYDAQGKNLSGKGKKLYDQAVQNLLNTALAVATIALTFKFGDKIGARWGIDLQKMTFLGVLPFPNAFALGLAGRVTWSAGKNALAAIAQKNATAAVKNIAIAAFAYFTTTGAFNWLKQYLYSCLPIPEPKPKPVSS